MVDFICTDYLERSGTRVKRELQIEKFLLTVGFEPGSFRLRSKDATTELRRTDVCRVNRSSPGFNCSIFRNLPAAHGRCNKIICRVFLSYNILTN